jgi:predicted MPP superfamily phosphohydrolase
MVIWFIIYLFINKLFKCKKIFIIDIVSVVVSIVYVLIGYYTATNVKVIKYNLETDKDISNLRIVQLTDSHIGSTMDGIKFAKYMEEINEYNPDVVVITGDFVDDDTKYNELVDACAGLSKLKTKYGVYFVFGNHDKAYFDLREFKTDDLRDELQKNNVVILEDDIIEITDNVVVVGRQDRTEESRKSILSLTSDVSSDKYMIVLDHQPNDFENEALAGADLVLSGHTHNGQIFPVGIFIRMFHMFDKTYGYEKRGNTNFIVSSGIGGWRVPFKTFANSEYTIIDVIKK